MFAPRFAGLATALLCLVAAVLLAPAARAADPGLPALTGRVVDGAHVLSAGARGDLETKLAALEAKSTIQFVVATVPSLGGQEIEPYANTLFRAWRLGEAKANNGVLLLVAPNEHRARIEVGYGLEGVLTDATSKLILANAATPRFKSGDFDGGVARAVDDIITALTTDSANWRSASDLKAKSGVSPFFFAIPFVLVFIVFAIVFIGAWRRGGFANSGFVVTSGGGGEFRSSSSSEDSGGFSGGGGSSGGGGASD
ncbi:MAG: TPM domain-containing protein, partial [Hyphomicrobiales bacterium]|nr:TPM domain-containing protein [Hyphomicrobiales bacterium]